jgi:MoxR-like ATPase
MRSQEKTVSNKCWSDLDNALKAGLDRVLLYGQPGTGKTYYCLNKHLPSMQNPTRQAYRLLCSTDMTKGDIEGMFRPNRDEWVFAESVCLTAWRTGGRLILDELDQAGGDALTGLLAVVDSSGSTVMNHPDTGEAIKPVEGFQVIATTNAVKLNDLPPALLDRFPVRININTPNPEAIELLPADLREIANGWISDATRRVSLRSFFTFDQARKTLPIETAARLVFASHATAITEAVRTATVISGATFVEETA